MANNGSPIIGLMISRSMTRPRSTARAMAIDQRQEPLDVAVGVDPAAGNRPVDEHQREEPGGDECDRSLGEVDRSRRLEHEHEAEGDEGVDRTLGEALGQGVDEAVERASPPLAAASAWAMKIAA